VGNAKTASRVGQRVATGATLPRREHELRLMLLALLYILLYCAVAVLVLLVVIWILEQIIGVPIPARIKQLLYAIVLILVLIAIVETVPFPPMRLR
jgi:chromate transport protein ChrA